MKASAARPSFVSFLSIGGISRLSVSRRCGLQGAHSTALSAIRIRPWAQTRSTLAMLLSLAMIVGPLPADALTSTPSPTPTPTPTPLPCATSIQSNFNGTVIAEGRTVWFNAIVKPSGIPTNASTTLYFTEQSIQFTAGGTPYNLSVPCATLHPAW